MRAGEDPDGGGGLVLAADRVETLDEEVQRVELCVGEPGGYVPGELEAELEALEVMLDGTRVAEAEDQVLGAAVVIGPLVLEGVIGPGFDDGSELLVQADSGGEVERRGDGT